MLTGIQARATGKPYTIADFDGLSLFVSANGAWDFRYTRMGQRARISLGSYPEPPASAPSGLVRGSESYMVF